MRIAVSGTHFMGKTTLIEDFVQKHPHYKHEVEPYYQLLDERDMELAWEPSLESLMEELDYSAAQINERANETNIIFDRCPLDLVAYAMCIAEKDSFDIYDSEVADRFDAITKALDNLDLIVFLPITKEYHIEYTEENPAYRIAADRHFKKIYRDEIFDIFPRHDHPQIIEIWGDRETRIKKIETFLS